MKGWLIYLSCHPSLPFPIKYPHSPMDCKRLVLDLAGKNKYKKWLIQNSLKINIIFCYCCILITLLLPFLCITLLLMPGYNFEHELRFAPCHSHSSFPLWFSPQPCSDVCCTPASLLAKPSWLVTLQPPLFPSPSPNSVLIRVHSSGKARRHGRKSTGFKSDDLVSRPSSDTYVSLQDPARIFGRYF